MTRVLLFSLLGLLLITLLGPLQRYFNLEVVVLDVPLITVLYMAMAGRGAGVSRQPPRVTLSTGGVDWSGGITGFILGYVTDVLGGGPKGIHCLSLTLTFLVSLWLARHVYLAGTLSVVAVAFLASVVTSVFAVTIRWATGVAPGLATLTVVLSQAVLCAALAPALMRLFRYVDAKLSRDPAERGSLCQ